MDIRVARAADRAAAAADAWLRDPRDVNVYGRLVAAVEDWRRLTRATLEEAAAGDVDEVSDALDDRAPARLGSVISDLAPHLRHGSVEAPASD